MKKVLSLVLAVLLFGFSVFPCGAVADMSQEETQCFEDGSFIIVSICEEYASEEGESSDFSFIKRLIEIFRKIIEFFMGGKEPDKTTEKTVKKTKQATYYDSKGIVLWRVYLEAEFYYDGNESGCKKAQAYCNIFDSDWSLISKSCSANGNTATADFTVKQYKLGVPLKTIEKTLTLVCDKDGYVV